MEEKVGCRTPAKGRDGVTNIPKWKYDLVSQAIISSIGDGLAFAELKEAVRLRLSAEDLARLGSLAWHVTSVKLEMEVRGELRRVDGISPQKLVLARS